jgi:hypothetical protein
MRAKENVYTATELVDGAGEKAGKRRKGKKKPLVNDAFLRFAQYN